jgi:hypothetical protein
MAPFSALRNSWQRLLHPYRTHDLCPANLCPAVANRVAQIPARVEEMSALRFHIRTAPQTLTEYQGV